MNTQIKVYSEGFSQIPYAQGYHIKLKTSPGEFSYFKGLRFTFLHGSKLKYLSMSLMLTPHGVGGHNSPRASIVA